MKRNVLANAVVDDDSVYSYYAIVVDDSDDDLPPLESSNVRNDVFESHHLFVVIFHV